MRAGSAVSGLRTCTASNEMDFRIAHRLALFVAALTATAAGGLLAANPAPSAEKSKPKNETQQKGEKPKTDPVRDALNEAFVAASSSWVAKNFAAVRVECGKVVAMASAPSHYKSYAHLRIAQSYMAEKNTAAAKAEYEKIKANAAYPEVHR